MSWTSNEASTLILVASFSSLKTHKEASHIPISFHARSVTRTSEAVAETALGAALLICD
jgi:hypothetical protein